MSYGQYYLLTVVCGFIASMLAASVSMLVAAKMHTISVAVCIPFFLYCLLPFIGRALSGYTTLFNLIPTILTNVQASVKVPLIYQIGNCVFRQIPLVMVMYTVMAIALLPFISHIQQIFLFLPQNSKYHLNHNNIIILYDIFLK